MSTSASDPIPGPAGFQLSALSNYTTEPGQLRGVSFWPRVGARLIDMVVHVFISVFVGVLIGIMVVIAAAGHPSTMVLVRLRHTTLLSFAAAMLGAILYHTICEAMHGSTLGKRMLSMVVLQEDGSPCRFGPALIRSLAYLVDALFFGLVGYFAMQRNMQEQRYGDNWAHTVVCRRDEVPAANLRSDSRFAAALLLAFFVDAACILLGMASKLVV